MRLLVVLKPWSASYPYGIVLRPGDLVTMIKSDPEFPGWIWCGGPAGDSAWIPEAYIEWLPAGGSGSQGLVQRQGRLLRDYESTELTVAMGETVVFLEEEADWIRAEGSDGRRGWLPASCLREKS
ncbi:MAG: hypothetical protein PHI34_00645 [Acidobacteriota bacterium]|nr:hypothetical protein [Acidobacteriota bacterium]